MSFYCYSPGGFLLKIQPLRQSVPFAVKLNTRIILAYFPFIILVTGEWNLMQRKQVWSLSDGLVIESVQASTQVSGYL